MNSLRTARAAALGTLLGLAGPALANPAAASASQAPAVAASIAPGDGSAAVPAVPAASPTAAAPPADPGLLENSQRYASPEDLETLKDVLEEKITRGVASRNRINFSGFATLGFGYSRDQYDLFRVSNANFTFSGFLREDPVDDGDLRYLVSAFYSGPSSGTTAGNTSSIRISDGVLLWDLVRQKRQLEPTVTATLTLGQQLIPFGSDNTAREDKLPTINRAQYVGALRLGRDVGLTVDGGFLFRYDPPSGLSTPVVAYTLGAYNGAGANRWDDNKAKDYVAKIVFAPESRFFSVFRGLKFGASLYEGNFGQDDLLRRDRLGAELEWLRKPFLLTAEYVRAVDQALTTGATPATVRTDSEAWVATLFYTASALPEFQPLVRFDFFDPNRDVGANARIQLVAGFNWFFYQVEPITRRTYEVARTERVVKLQLNYVRTWDRAAPDGNQFLGQLVASF